MQFTHATEVTETGGRPSRRRAVMAALGLALVGGALGVNWRLRHGADPAACELSPAPTKAVDFRARGVPLPADAVQALRAPAVRAPGYAVIVGVGGPRDGGASAGAAQVYRQLRDRYGFEPGNVRLLVDRPRDATEPGGEPLPVTGDPTPPNVLQALREIGAKTSLIGDGRSNFVLYVGGQGEARALAERTGLDAESLSRYVRQVVASTHQVLVLDRCYGGGATARGLDGGDPGTIYERWEDRAHAILTAGAAAERPHESDGTAVFTPSLVRGLSPDGSGRPPADGNGDGAVTDHELAAYLRGEVSARVRALGDGRALTPQYLRGGAGDGLGQFLFIPR